jgi:hypothetical protein
VIWEWNLGGRLPPEEVPLESAFRATLASIAALGALLFAVPAHAIINQVDGTIVPVTTRLQSCLDKSPTQMPVGGEGPGVLNAIRGAAIRPQTFLPNSSGASAFQVTFYDVGEGGGYRNRFGWYHVGTSPFVAANRHEIFDCRDKTAACDCPCTAGARSVNGPARACQTWVNANTVRVDFACLRALPTSNAERWDGGPIAFYLMTPELLDGSGSSPNSCAPAASTANRVYSTDNTVNDDGDYLHFLIYESRNYPQSYYFGFEDLFRGGDNDFEDMLVRANGLVPSCNPEPEVCDNRDNNCDGIVDNFDEPCSSACGTGTRTCTAGVWGACSARTPTAEVCNGLDDNCDGQIDEGLTNPCTSACGPGTSYCVDGRYGACVSTRTPTAEICNGIDDNCDGRIDEDLTRSCSSACGSGIQVCTAGTWGSCSARQPSPEVCDGLDNDCNGLVDDGLVRACSTACGTGTEACMAGRWTGCTAPLPLPEICNGVDDDCDGMIDNGVPPGGACGRNVGACRAGAYVCEGGTYVCRGATTGTPEECNGIDDDCDGEIDNGIPAGGACNVSTDGMDLCMPGLLICRGGAFVCEGGSRGGVEVCDCLDNDCDGEIDNPPAGGSICPGGGECIACQCRTPCRDDLEFPCSAGLVCRDGFCVPPTCGGVLCADGEICIDDRCADPCSRTTCDAGQVCRRGLCIEDSCYTLGCPDPAQVCINGACEADRCRGTSCPEGQYCRDGACVRTCAGVRCTANQSCRDGQCLADPCASVRCSSAQRCEVREGRGVCVADACVNIGCGEGRRCERGACVDDPCARIECPGGDAVVCRNGQCESRVQPRPFVPDRGIVGGGGFGCSAQPGGASSRGWLAVAGALLALLTLRRRGRLRAGVPVASAAALALVLGGCRSEPYCFNCQDADLVGPEDARTVDVIPIDGCSEGAEEICNGLDDNCNGEVDEGFDLQTDRRHCGACNHRCEVAHAIPQCVAGRCVIETCDIGFYDLDRNPLNGCEYACTPTGAEICDGRDNNCDGRIDEGFDLQTDRSHCGACNHVCRFEHASASCVAGACRIGTCDPGFVDLDGNPANGCEYACEPTGPEVCDGRDNNCDGQIDEGVDLLTDPRNCGACGRVCQFLNGVPGCTAGVCTLTGCAPGFLNDPRNPMPNCNRPCGDAMGRVGPELCDGFDNNCDGQIDEGFTDLGASCEVGMGDCRRTGNRICAADGRGTVCNVSPGLPGTEVCDGRDNNCNGLIDELPLPGIGASAICGSNIGRCTFGAFACVSGAPVCQGGTGPVAEVCNGIDDNCNGQVDEGVTAPPGMRCNPRGSETTGVCAMVTRRCGGAAGWQCVYPSTYRDSDNEELCDGLDNNCDGRVDEGCLTRSTERRLDQGNGNSIQPMITGASGGLGVVYLDRRNGRADIFFNRSTDGLTWASDLRIDNTTSDSVQPWLAGSGTNFYGVWSDFRLNASRRSVYANVSTNLGVAWGTDKQAANTGTTDAFNIRVVSSGNNITAVFEELYTDRSRHIHVAVSRDGGATWPTFVRVDHGPAATVASTPAVAMGSPGTIYVVWRDNRNGQSDVYFNRSLDYGATWLATDVRMDTDAAGSHSSEAPSIAADTMDNVYVAWQDTQTPPFTRFDIYTRSSRDRGTTWNAANVRADADSIAHDSRTPIALSVNGAFAVVWLDDRHGRSNVYATRSADGGATFPSRDVRVQTNVAGISAAGSLTAATSNGIVFVGWQDDRDPSMNSPLDIYANYSLDGGRTYQPSDIRMDGAPAGVDSETPFVYSANGIGHYVWVDRRNDLTGGNGDIYYRSLR